MTKKKTTPRLYLAGELVTLDGSAPAQHMSTRARHYAGKSRRPSTAELYRRALTRYAAWCEASTRDPWTPETAGEYIAARRDATCSTATLGQDRAAIAAACKATGRPSPFLSPAVRAVALGAERDALGNPVRQAVPLAFEDWSRACAVLEAEAREARTELRRWRATRDRALLIVGYLTGRRKAELMRLTVGDIVAGEQGLTITFRKTKRSDKPTVAHILRRRGATDPVEAWSALADAEDDLPAAVDAFGWRDDEGSAPAWLRVDGRPLGADHALERILQKALALARVKHPERYTAHSLRAGIAMAMAERGAPMTAIADHLGMRSTRTAERYARRARAWTDSPLRFLED